jgi:hypothetical protein
VGRRLLQTTDATSFVTTRHRLVLHWNGRAWGRIKPPPRRAGRLWKVEVLGPRRIWVLGLGKQDAIYEWNGSRWTALPCPPEIAELGWLDLAVRTATDAWATTGTATAARAPGPYVVRWDGRRWSRKAWPRLQAALLEAIAPLSSDYAWIVGSVGFGGSPSRTLIMRWNGRTWRVVPSPSPGRYSSLVAVDAVSADDAWALGARGDRPLVEHWDGRRWRVIRSPSFWGFFFPEDIAAIARTTSGLWVKGLCTTGVDGRKVLPLRQHSRLSTVTRVASRSRSIRHARRRCSTP